MGLEESYYRFQIGGDGGTKRPITEEMGFKVGAPARDWIDSRLGTQTVVIHQDGIPSGERFSHIWKTLESPMVYIGTSAIPSGMCREQLVSMEQGRKLVTVEISAIISQETLDLLNCLDNSTFCIFQEFLIKLCKIQIQLSSKNSTSVSLYYDNEEIWCQTSEGRTFSCSDRSHQEVRSNNGTITYKTVLCSYSDDEGTKWTLVAGMKAKTLTSEIEKDLWKLQRTGFTYQNIATLFQPFIELRAVNAFNELLT